MRLSTPLYEHSLPGPASAQPRSLPLQGPALHGSKGEKLPCLVQYRCVKTTCRHTNHLPASASIILGTSADSAPSSTSTSSCHPWPSLRLAPSASSPWPSSGIDSSSSLALATTVDPVERQNTVKPLPLCPRRRRADPAPWPSTLLSPRPFHASSAPAFFPS